jgi:phage FluMu gp28-like protein
VVNKVPVTSSELPGRSPLGVVKRDPRPDEVDKIVRFAASEVGFVLGGIDQDRLNMLAAAGEEWEWEDPQIRYLMTEGWYAANKPRQLGMSAVFAILALCRGILARRNYTAIFASYKKEEAISKINYAKQFLECLPVAFQKDIIRDPLQLIEWRNANGTIAKIISHAQKPIRGHHGDVWLDEFAFFQDDKLIFDSCIPVVTQVNGTIHVASTPFGKAGMFYDIVTDRQKYTEFSKAWIAWWHCKRYLKDPSEAGWRKAVLEAPSMSTEERVYRFGNAKIKIQFKTLDIETFRQEFEGLFVDEQAFFFSRSLIMKTMFDNMDEIFDDYDPLQQDFTIPIEEALANNKFSIQKVYPNVEFKRYDTLDGLTAAIRRGKVTPNLYAGIDVGATRHSTDIRILEEIPIKNPRPDQCMTLQVERFKKNAREWDPDEQINFMIDMLRRGFIQKLLIDGNGLGYMMAHKLRKMFPTVVESITFNHVVEKRNRFMNNLRRRMESNGLALCQDRETIEDLHSVRTVLTQNRKQRFVTQERKLHHGDGAWSLSFASLAGTPLGQEAILNTSVADVQTAPGWNVSLPGHSRAEEIESQEDNLAAQEHLSKLKINRGDLISVNQVASDPYLSTDNDPYITGWDD